MKSITEFIIALLMLVLMTNCQNSSAQKNINQNSLVAPDKTETKSQSISGKANNYSKYPGWILQSPFVQTFYKPFFEFYAINGRYPYDMKEYLESGLPMAWPADPLSGKPMELVENLEAKATDWGKISYVRKSDNEAYFNTLSFDLETESYTMSRIPNSRLSEIDIPELAKMKQSDMPIAEFGFHPIIGGLFGAVLNKDEFKKQGRIPSGVEDAMSENYFWIKENISPDYISDNPKEYVFLECGWGYLDGQLVVFISFTIPGISGNDSVIPVHYADITTFTSQSTVGNPDVDIERITDKTYFYSTRKILDRTLNLPESVLISRDEILNLGEIQD